ncbi:MAG TPA: transporter substrate-binding domain-containing protein, partial [Chitinophagales bacterium]|nr:transporter substrate-binding domain-containing protein [Chitinophagales bacterium]
MEIEDTEIKDRYNHRIAVRRFFFAGTVFLSLLLTGNCDWKTRNLIFWESDEPSVKIDLDEIIKRGRLIVITGFNPLGYFIYKGTPMGYDYELLKMFTNDLGIGLELRVVHHPDSIYYLLNSGQGDVIAFGQTVTKAGMKHAVFTDPHMEVRQVLVQRKPDGWEKMKGKELENHLIREPHELAGMQVHVIGGSSHFERILDLAEEIGYEIDVVPIKGELTADDLIRMVAEKEISYTIADENVAMLNSTYYPNIDVGMSISEPRGLAWAVRKNSPQLLEALNDWLRKKRKSEAYNVIFRKYFKSKKNIIAWAQSDYFSGSGGMISEYDNLIRRYA